MEEVNNNQLTMEFRFHCPFCGQKLKADETAVSKAVDCPSCRREFLVPEPMSTTYVPEPEAREESPPPLPSLDQDQLPSLPQSQSPAPEPNPDGEHTCPVCWLRFDGGDIMHVAVHDSLRGDSILGEDAQQRFLATRFNNAGQALDALGLPCSEIACPHCRRRLPPGFLETEHHIVSIVGDQSAGKSYYLGVLTKMLPSTLYRDFHVIFQDSDPTGNAPVNDMRKTLFAAQTPAQAKLAKTQMTGGMYESLPRQGRTVMLPRPFVYSLTSLENREEKCAVIFYDNAGEHFQPGVNIVEQPGAQHVASAAGILFLFDPFNSPEFRREMTGTQDPQLEKTVIDQQDIILAEMRARITYIRNLPLGKQIDTPIAFVLGKCDAWWHLLKGQPLLDPVKDGKLDSQAIEQNSERLRGLLVDRCPAVVANAEALTSNIQFFAASAFGHTPLKIGPGDYVPDPAKLKPMFVETPVLWLLTQMCPGIVETLDSTNPVNTPSSV
jgi:hypothetical protein